MTVTIHSILNSVLWGGVLAVGLSVLSRNRRFLCRFGVFPLAALSTACLLRCCLPVELTFTKEVGATALNRLHRLIDRAAGSTVPEPWIFGVWITGTVLGLALWLPRYILQIKAVKCLPATADKRIQNFCQERGLHGLHIVITPRVHTPCVIGFWQETILLPEASYTNRQLAMILRHESVHVKHHDGPMRSVLVESRCSDLPGSDHPAVRPQVRYGNPTISQPQRQTVLLPDSADLCHPIFQPYPPIRGGIIEKPVLPYSIQEKRNEKDRHDSHLYCDNRPAGGQLPGDSPASLSAGGTGVPDLRSQRGRDYAK